MECLYIMFYVVELSASEHLFEISAIQIWYLIIIIILIIIIMYTKDFCLK